MRRATNIFLSAIMLTMILFNAFGVSIEKCSCTGKISLAIPVDEGCCPGEGGCMTVKSMQLSDYMPTTADKIDMPVFPVLFALFPPIITTSTSFSECLMESHCAEAPPGALANTVSVLRV